MGADLAMLNPSGLNLKNLLEVERLQSSLPARPMLTRLEEGLMTLAVTSSYLPLLPGGGESGGFSYLEIERERESHHSPVRSSPINTETASPSVGIGRPAHPEERLTVLAHGGQAGPPLLGGRHHGVLLTASLVAAAARHCRAKCSKILSGSLNLKLYN